MFSTQSDNHIPICPYQIIISLFVPIFNITSLLAAELEEPKLAYEVKGKRWAIYQTLCPDSSVAGNPVVISVNLGFA